MDNKILLIDGHSILNRAFYGLPDLTNAEGVHTGAVYGFLNILFRILEEEKPDYLAVAFDMHGPTFRHKMFDAYKGTRHAMPEELRMQVPLMQDMLSAMNVEMMMLQGFEADDLIGTMARRSEEKGMQVTILSGDRDLLQLVTDRVTVRLPKTSKGQTTIENYHPGEVKERFGVTPPQIIELKALMGDSSDNIPGLPGVGEKTAAKIIGEFASIENAFAHVEEVKPPRAREAMREHYDLAVLSKKLATIDTDAPLSFDWDRALLTDLFTRPAYELCKKLEFKNLLDRFGKQENETAVLENEVFVCEGRESAEALFEKLSGEESAGVGVLAEDGELLGITLCFGENELYAIPAEDDVTAEYIGGKLRALSVGTVLCSTNMKEILAFSPLEDPERIFDAGIAAYLLNPLKAAYPYDDLAREYLNGILLPARTELLGKASLKKALDTDREAVFLYGGYMAYTAFRARKPLLEALEDTGMLAIYREIELPLVFVLSGMEKYGILVKGEELKAYGEKLSGRISELEQQIYGKAGEVFNIQSPKQLGVILFEKLSLPGGKKTKTGYSTAADILEKLSEEYPIVKDILEYRQLTKLKSTYADGLSGVIAEDGRIHSTFNQTITATGRISSTEPNLQNIPVRMALGREIRKVFVPEEGFVFIDADYSQIELRVLAHMSGDEKLIQAYREAEDIHALTASEVFHVPLSEVTPLQRRNAKAVNFGIVYGISSFGLSQDLSITRKEAAEYIEKYFETYPGIKAFLDRMVREAKESGYSVTMYGRRRPIPELSSGNFMQRSFGERVAMNAPIQGSAADIIKIAMNRVFRRMKEEGLKSRLLLQVHDELLIEAAEEEADRVAEILQEEMKGAASLAVELEIDMHRGRSWYEAK